ncbi:MAG TPA: hypothetical protein VFB78_16370 [Acidimicrobiales bacterium]|nr:hypothetical protein [Acidimicrobiales bacterium]
MADAEVRRLFRTLSKQPDVIEAALNAASVDERRQILDQAGVLQAAGGLTLERDALIKDITKLLTPALTLDPDAPRPGPGGGRPRPRPGPGPDPAPGGEVGRTVEWVAAVATAAAGAAAAACSAD